MKNEKPSTKETTPKNQEASKLRCNDLLSRFVRFVNSWPLAGKYPIYVCLQSGNRLLVVAVLSAFLFFHGCQAVMGYEVLLCRSAISASIGAVYLCVNAAVVVAQVDLLRRVLWMRHIRRGFGREPSVWCLHVTIAGQAVFLTVLFAG